jgi:hypothetical protein
MTDPAPGWESILRPEETLIWQGQPDGSFSFRPQGILMAVFGFAFASIAVIWMQGTMRLGGYFWLLGGFHLAIGLCVGLWGLFGATFLNRHTWYSLTSERVFIATELPFHGRRLREIDLTPSLRIDLIDGPLPEIRFVQEGTVVSPANKAVPDAFLRLADGLRIYGEIRKAQANRRQSSRGL